MFKHLLVTTDGSKLSDKAVNAAIGLARDLGAKLTGFHATEDYPIMPFPEYAMFAESLTPAMWKEDEERRVLLGSQTFGASAHAGHPTGEFDAWRGGIVDRSEVLRNNRVDLQKRHTLCKRRCVRCNSMRRAALWCYARWIYPFPAIIRS